MNDRSVSIDCYQGCSDTSSFVYSYSRGIVVRSFRAWQNDRTLFVKHLKFVCQAECLKVWPHWKTMIFTNCLLLSEKDVFEIIHKHLAAIFAGLAMFYVTKCSNIAWQAMFLNVWQQCFVCLPRGYNLANRNNFSLATFPFCYFRLQIFPVTSSFSKAF